MFIYMYHGDKQKIILIFPQKCSSLTNEDNSNKSNQMKLPSCFNCVTQKLTDIPPLRSRRKAINKDHHFESREVLSAVVGEGRLWSCKTHELSERLPLQLGRSSVHL